MRVEIRTLVPPDLRDWVDQRASEEGRSRSAMVARLLEQARATEERACLPGMPPTPGHGSQT